MRPQRQMWICGEVTVERLKLGRGWQVRIPLKPWRSKVPVPWTAPIVDRRPASERELLIARAFTPGWPPEGHVGFTSAFVVLDARNQEHIFPQSVTLITQRLRTPQRDQEMKEWNFR